ncbi:MAG: phosphoribosyltransferase family protein [Micropruina sp.]|uniref:ComF family protein n=1 Tax=Micropruina sp. TaxID=2737536 RepID=UPI0039E6AF49
MKWSALLDAMADLAWGGCCAACGQPGPVCCRTCADSVRGLVPRRVDAGNGVTPIWARGDYTDELRALILACKERQGLGLVPLLGDLVEGSVAAVVHDRWRRGPVMLVPIPSSRATVAARGFDLTWLLARRAASRLGRLGLDIQARRDLTLASGSRDQVGLGVEDRASNRRGGIEALPSQPAQIVLLDDIVTTGATLAAAVDALESVGHRLLGAGVIAATPRLDGRPRAVR